MRETGSEEPTERKSGRSEGSQAPERRPYGERLAASWETAEPAGADGPADAREPVQEIAPSAPTERPGAAESPASVARSAETPENGGGPPAWEAADSGETSEAGDAPDDQIGQPRHAVEPGRYLDPGPAIEARLQRAHTESGGQELGAWVREINPKYYEFPHHTAESIPWTNNCGDCSRRFADAYQDVDVHAAWGDGREIPGPGEAEEMWRWAGVAPMHGLQVEAAESHADFTRNSWETAGRALEKQPVGTVAIIGVDWHSDDPYLPDGSAGGHWFNAVVTERGVAWVDAQNGKTTDWPPDYPSAIWRLEAVVRRPGEQWEEADLV